MEHSIKELENNPSIIKIKIFISEDIIIPFNILHTLMKVMDFIQPRKLLSRENQLEELLLIYGPIMSISTIKMSIPFQIVDYS